MNKKITSSVLAALMVAGSTSFTAFAAMPAGTVVIGTQAFDLAYANDVANAEEIGNAIVAGGAVYVKDFSGDWIDNLTGEAVASSVIPAVTYTDATGTTNYAAEDSDEGASSVAVSAISAKSFKVVFNGAPTDISKVVFAVKRGTTPVVMTPVWNATNTEATLSYVANLPQDAYTVNVMNGTTDLGTSTVAVTKEKIAKIDVVGDVLAVAAAETTYAGTPPVATTTAGYGFVSYKVYNQYGQDITTTSLASSSNITWSCSIGSIKSAKDGLITIESYSTSLLTLYTSAVVTGINSDSATTITKTLTVSPSQGTLSNIALNTLTNVNDAVFTQGSNEIFYLDFTALDLSGNATTNKTLVEAGLLDSDAASGTQLYSSNTGLVTAEVVADPDDSSKALIEVKQVANSASIYTDTPIIITAMTKTGKTSSITLDLKKASTLNTLSISSPNVQIAAGDTNVEVPYEAFDQDGVKLTKYSDIVSSASNTQTSATIASSGSDTISSMSAGMTLSKNADGTLKITIDLIPSVTTVYQIVTKAGKSSMITVKGDDVAVADSLSIDTSSVKQFMQQGASQTLDFGVDKGNLSLLDQYGRAINLTADNAIGLKNYSVKATTSGAVSIVAIPAADNEAYIGNQIKVNAGTTVGTQTVTFTVMDVTNPSTPVSTGISKTMSFTVVDESKIVGLSSNAVSTLYAFGTSGDGYRKSAPTVYGKLSSGTLVTLKGSNIVNRAVNSNAFYVDAAGKIYANAITDGTTGATATFSTTVLINGSISTVTTPVTSSTVAPTATSVDINVDEATKRTTTPVAASASTGFSIDGDTITASTTAMDTLFTTAGTNFVAEYANGVAQAIGAVYFSSKDQYGTKGLGISYATTNNSANKYSVSATGQLISTTGTASQGDTFTLTAVSAGGMTKTVKFIVE